jgi:integrase
MTKTLNDRFVAGIKCLGRDNFFDTKSRGLVLRVSARTKTWYFTYRNNGPTQWLRLGDYPSMLLADARTRAANERAALLNGVDPVAERRKEPEPLPPNPAVFTFADFVPTFIAFQKGRKKTWYDDEATIHRHLLPTWGALPLRSITRTHVHELLDARVGDGMTVGVNRIQSLISRIFTVALDRSLIDAHPAARMIKRFDERPRDRVLSDEELRTLWAQLDARPGTASDALRLRVLLGQRGDETAGLLWREIDFDHGAWLLGRTRTKNGQPHVVALPPTALALLSRRRALLPDDEPRVFPGLALSGGEHKALSDMHGGAFEWIDLRRTVATRLANLGFDETTIGRVLNHARHTVTQKHYNQHRYVEETRQALTAWDRELQRILAGKPRTATAVRPFVKGA